jgi:regulator of protease activity HflC (stomatin/prohibitin superfamily)
MRLAIKTALAVALLFVLLKPGWPWPILVLPIYLIVFGIGLPPFGNRPLFSTRFLIFASTFLTVAGFLSWLVSIVLLWPQVQNEFVQRYVLLSFLLSNELLVAFWSVAIGTTVPLVLLVTLLMPYGLIAGQSMYCEYEQYGGHERQAAISAICSLLGISQGTWIVSGGNAEVHGQMGGALAIFGGPGLMIVQEGHAVILERSGKLTRIAGRGIAWLEPFERISRVVPLYGRSETVTVGEVATRDRILIDEFEVMVFHRLDAGPEDEQVVDGRFAYNRDTLLRVVWSPVARDWRDPVRSIAAGAVRDFVGRYDLEQIVPMSEDFRSRFRSDLRQAMNSVTRGSLGVEITSVDIGKIRIPADASRRLLEKWLADWAVRIAQSEREALIRRGEAEAVILKVKEVAWAQAQKQVIEEIAASFQNVRVGGPEVAYVIALRALETVEKMAGDPATKILLPPEMLMQLQDLRQAIGSSAALPAGRTP